MDGRNEFQLEKTPLEDPPRQNMDEGNELQTGITPLEEPLNRLSISRNQPIPSAFKLGNEGDNVPDHFKVLVNNTIVDRWRLIQTNKLNPTDFSLECDLLCCVALTIALEEGMRLNELHPTDGFDLRVFRELTNMPPFRMPNNTYKISLLLTRVPELHFTMVLIPIGKDFCTLNFMAAGENSKYDTLKQRGTGVPLPRHIEAADNVKAKISNLSSLASIIRPVIYSVMQQVFADRKIALPNNLMGITEDTQTYIFKFLKVKDFLSMCEVNLYFHWFFRHHEWLWIAEKRMYTCKQVHTGQMYLRYLDTLMVASKRQRPEFHREAFPRWTANLLLKTLGMTPLRRVIVVIWRVLIGIWSKQQPLSTFLVSMDPWCLQSLVRLFGNSFATVIRLHAEKKATSIVQIDPKSQGKIRPSLRFSLL